MIQYLSVIKGIHPGFLLERELKLRNIPKNRFAQMVDEHPQTIVSITKGRRKMNISLALKIEKILGIEEGTLMVLQVYYDIERQKKLQAENRPELSKLRTILFWDTNLDSINWEKQKKAIIKRVFERGNESEQEEIRRCYGENAVNEAMQPYGK